MKIRTKAQ